MKQLLYILFLLLNCLCFAQRQQDDVATTVKEARQIVFKQPDSARALVKKVLAKSSLHDTVFGVAYNVCGIYHGMRGNNDSLIHYQKKSISHLENYPKLKAQSLVSLSVGYRNKADYDSAITNLNLALELNRRVNYNVGVAVDYGELASVYNVMADYEKSTKYLVKAIAILKKEKNQDKLPALQQKLANTYLAQENFKFAIDLYRDCLESFKKMGQMKNYYLTEVNMAEAMIHINDVKGAKTVLYDAAAGLEQFGDKSILGICYAKIGHAEELLKNYSKSEVAFSKAVELLAASGSNRVVRIAGEYMEMLNKQRRHAEAMKVLERVKPLGLYKDTNPDDRVIYDKAVADAYSGTNNDKEAIKAYQRTILTKDSIAEHEQELAIQQVQAKYQTELQREKNLSLQKSNTSLAAALDAEKKLFWLYTILAVSVIVLSLLALRSYRLKARLQDEKLKTVEAERNMIQQQHLHEQELTNAQRETIDEKQRELTSTALRMANFQDSLNQIIDKCNSGEISRVSDLKKELQLLSKQEDYWKQFETRFNHLHPEFGTSLQNRFSRLTKNDIEFCSLLKLNLSNKEIASLLQISHESAITKKYRIKKKMEIQDDEEFERLLTQM